MLLTVFISWLLLYDPLISTAPHASNETKCCDVSPLLIFHDVSGQLTLNEVKAKVTDFVAAGDNLSFGYQKGAYWLHLTLTPTSVGQWWWVFDYPSLDHVTLYLENTTGILELHSGDTVPLPQRAFVHRKLVFPLVLPATESSTLWLRVVTEGSVTLSYQLLDNDTFIAHTRYAYLLPALYFGLIIALASYNFLLYLALREKAFLWYVLFVLGFGIGALSLNGLGAVFIWSEILSFGNRMLPLGFTAASLAAILFTRDFLHTRQFLPSWDPWLRRLIVLKAFALISVFFIPVQVALIVMSLIGIMTVFTLTICAIKGMLQHAPGARLFALAWSMLWLGTVVMSLRNFGVLPSNTFTVNAMQLGSAIEMILISLGLAQRFNRLKQQHSVIQQQMLQTEQRRVAELQQHETELEFKVQQRTAELERLNQRLQVLASTDTLTNLANRSAIYQQLQQARARSLRYQRKMALFFIDLDGFKQVNDEFGHQAGDWVLKEVSKRLLLCCRQSDLAGRLGGDEFLVICEDISLPQQLTELHQRLQDSLNQPYHYGEQILSVTASIGVLYTDAKLTADTMLEYADKAMYAEKQRKRTGRLAAEH
ncbi:diguanylate cyclase domain-containing protein [Alishewanella longhuensis]|nr:diguanylate cyclase [Alishewanella longhuensis]